MPQLIIKIKDKTAKPLNNCVVCDNSDYTVKFIFDEEWEKEPLRIARFIWNKQYVDVQFTGDTCEVPVVSKTNNLAIGVYAGDLRTTTPAILTCHMSILSEDVIEHSVTPSEYEEIMKLLNAQATDIAALKATDKAIWTQIDNTDKKASLAQGKANQAYLMADDALTATRTNATNINTLKTDVNSLKTDKLDKSAVDSTLSPTSENPVQNKVVYEAIQNAGSKITVDNVLSPTSENPVQNKVVTQAINTSNQNINILKSRVQAVEDGMNPDISADFLTSEGFGNLRYYNGHFQKYDTNSDTWVDTTATPDNVYIFNMVPQAIKQIRGTYDTDLCKYKIKFEEPDDTIIDGQLVCIVDKIIIRRKLGSAPENENDGDFIAEIKRREFGLYKNNWFVDNTLTPNLGDVYYYKVFPVSTLGHINYSTANETRGLICKDYFLYGFKINQNESDPASMITYLSDCDNYDYTPAHMDYTADTFDYGDWEGAWFIEKLKPCMLRYDGTVDYELDKNDYTKKADGTPSDVSNTDYEGNAMVGIPKVYWKIIDNGDDTANIYICETKPDDDFVCWSHIDNNGNEINYCYMPIYNGWKDSIGRLRSLSGKAPTTNLSCIAGITAAKLNNTTDDVIWYTEVLCDKKLIELLGMLIAKNTDSQTVFGVGNANGGDNVLKTGTMDTKGVFWGANNGTSGVKFFGIENYWGNLWRNTAGWINDHGIQKIKMTYGTSDGSTVTGYNTDGSGYITVGNSMISGTDSGYIDKMILSENGLVPTVTDGSSSTYYCDNLWFSNNQVSYSMVGGGAGHSSLCGLFCSSLSHSVEDANWNDSVTISCKPLSPTI